MIDFDKIISSVRSEGFSIEDIAAKFSEALNKAAKTEKKPSPRETLISHMEQTFDEHYKGQRLDLSDAAALVWLCAVKDTEVGKSITDVKELVDLYEFIGEDLEGTIEKWRVHKAIMPVLGLNKSKGKRCACDETETCGTGRKAQTDEEKVKDFLRGLFS